MNTSDFPCLFHTPQNNGIPRRALPYGGVCAGLLLLGFLSAPVAQAQIRPAIIVHPQSQTAAAGTPITLSVIASGSAPLSYIWHKNRVVIPGATSSTLAFPSVQPSDAADYRVVVRNTWGSVTSQEASIQVSGEAISPPSITAQPQSQTVSVGSATTFSVSVSGTSPFGYQWKKNNVAIADANSSSLSLSGIQLSDAGTYTVAISNAAGSATSAPATLTVNDANKPPALTDIGPQTVDEESLLSFTVNASDSDAPPDTLTYYAVALPDGAAFDPATRRFTWAPREDQGPGTYRVTFGVEDNGTPKFKDEEEVILTVNEVNKAPELTLIGNKAMDEEILLSFTIPASDPDVPANTLTYYALGLPEGAAFDPATGRFTWTPRETASPGTFEVTFTVSDGQLSASETVAITVNEVDDPPMVTIDSITDDTGRILGLNDVVFVGQRLVLTGSFTDPDQPESHAALITWGNGQQNTLSSVAADSPFTIAQSQFLTVPMDCEIKLTVTDRTGLWGAATRPIKVVDPASGLTNVVSNLTALLVQLSPSAAQAAQSAIDAVIGNNGGAANNGATDKLEQGNASAALAKMRQAIEDLQAAAAINPLPELIEAQKILALAAAAVVTEVANAAALVATRPVDLLRVDAARALIQSGRTLIVSGDFLDAMDTFQITLNLLNPLAPKKANLADPDCRLIMKTNASESGAPPIQLLITGPAGTEVEIERADDLKNWREFGRITIPYTGVSEFKIPKQDSPATGFFRLKQGLIDLK